MSTNLHDISGNIAGAGSLLPGSVLDSGAESGVGVDMHNVSGNCTGLFCFGESTGSPTTEAYALKLQESDSAGGSYSDIPNATLSLPAAAGGSYDGLVYGITTGLRSKRYVKTVATPTFVGGSSPEMPISGVMVGQKGAIGVPTPLSVAMPWATTTSTTTTTTSTTTTTTSSTTSTTTTSTTTTTTTT